MTPALLPVPAAAVAVAPLAGRGAIIITNECRANAGTKCVIGEHAEGREREQRGGAQSRGMCRFCACGTREAWCVVLGVVRAWDG
jgi:hypothetical protein